MRENNHINFIFNILLLTIIVFFAFIILTPKISSIILPFRRDVILNSFINRTLSTNKIDPKIFWQFREFYCPGYFIFNKNRLDENMINDFSRTNNIIIDASKLKIPFLFYNCNRLQSLESLVEKDNFDVLFKFKEITPEKIIFKNKNSVISIKKNRLNIIFLLSTDEMKKANGFFDYREKDKELIKGKYWLVITSLIPN